MKAQSKSTNRETVYRRLWDVAVNSPAKVLLYVLAMFPVIQTLDPSQTPAVLTSMGASAFIALLDRVGREQHISDEDIQVQLEQLANQLDDQQLESQIVLKDIQSMLAHLNIHIDRATADLLAHDTHISQKLQEIVGLLTHPYTSVISEEVRLAHLDRLYKESREWCIVRWQASGLSIEQATQFADDPSIGAPSQVLQSIDKNVVLLLAGVGSGKTLTVHRILQQAIIKARNDSGAPLPIWIEGEYSGRLKDRILTDTNHLGHPQEQGAMIVVDRADELGAARAAQLLTEARWLTQVWQNTTVIIASRPISSFVSQPEVVSFPELTETEALQLVRQIAGLEPSEYGITLDMPDSIQKAIQRPLFSILLGIYLRQNLGLPRSTGQLLAYLVERALREISVDGSQSFDQLEMLARESIDRESTFVPRGEILRAHQVDELLRSGLIAFQSDSIGFPLPILAQWFAAQSLIHGTPSVDHILKEPKRLERWRYPLVIALSDLNYEQASMLLTPIVEEQPAFASEIVVEALDDWGLDDNISLPGVDECRQRIDTAITSWLRGIGPELSTLIAPISPDGSAAFEVEAKGRWISVEWSYEDGTVSERHDSVGRQSAWAWRLTLSELTRSLDNVLNHELIPIKGTELAVEAIWKAALEAV